MRCLGRIAANLVRIELRKACLRLLRGPKSHTKLFQGPERGGLQIEDTSKTGKSRAKGKETFRRACGFSTTGVLWYLAEDSLALVGSALYGGWLKGSGGRQSADRDRSRLLQSSRLEEASPCEDLSCRVSTTVRTSLPSRGQIR